MNHDDLGNYSHSYVADLRAQLQAANERAEVLTIYEQRLDEARRERDIAEQTNAALKAEVERLTKKCDEWKACAERVDARMLHEQSDHNKTVDRLIAARALNDRLAGALKPFLENTGVCAPIASDHPLTGPWVKYRDGLVGRWAEDGSPYYIRLPAQLADSLIEAQRLATLAYLGRDALSAYAKSKEAAK